MALEFAGKVVLLVDGSSLSSKGTGFQLIPLSPRLDCARNDLEGDHPDGSRRRGEEGHHGLLCPSNPVRSPSPSLSPIPRLTRPSGRYPNVYGIDMPSRHELVAHHRTEEEISTVIGADLVIFQTLPDLIHSCSQFNPSLTEFDCSVFTGKYVTGGVDEAYLAGLETMRSDNAKIKQKARVTGPHGLPLANGHGETGDGGKDVAIPASMPMDGPDADDESQVVGLNNARNGAPGDHPDLTMGLSNLGVE